MQALLDAIAALEWSQDARRVFHGRGGLHPGCEHLCLDIFPPVVLLTSFEPLSDETLAHIDQALQVRWSQWRREDALTWVYQYRHSARTETRLMRGEVPEPHVVQEDGAQYRVHLMRGQNHGLFLDMAQGRRWLRQQLQHLSHAKVLNLFAYTCAFSVVALQAGAKQVVNVDMSHSALAIGQQNHALNQLSGASFWSHDIFSTWGKITRSGPYHCVIVDPPSYQKGSFVATKDYARLMRRLPDLLVPHGHVMLCLNAPELGVDFLTTQMTQLAPGLQFVERVDNPSVYADISADRALKVLIYQA